MGSATHDELVERFRYFGGHSDTLGLFADAGILCSWISSRQKCETGSSLSALLPSHRSSAAEQR